MNMTSTTLELRRAFFFSKAAAEVLAASRKWLQTEAASHILDVNESPHSLLHSWPHS